MAQIHLIVDAAGNAINFATADGAEISAFGEQMVAELTSQVYTTFPYAIESGLVVTSGIGAYSVVHESGTAKLTTGTETSGLALINTKGFLQYIPGVGGSVRFTPQFDTSVTGTALQYVGYGDAHDGFFIGMSGSTLGIFQKHFGKTINFTPSGSFNGDALDWGINLDKGNVLGIDFQWLGYGNIRYMIESPLTGRYVTMHNMQYANSYNIPSMENPSMPLCMMMENNGEAQAMTGKIGCLQGGIQGKPGLSKTFGASGAVTLDNANNELQLFTVRNKTTFRGVENRRTVVLTAVSVGVNGNNEAIVEGVRGVDLTSPTWVDVDEFESVVEIDKVGTFTTHGAPFGGSLVGRNSATSVPLEPFKVHLAPGDAVTVFAQRAGGSTLNIFAFLTWKELY